MPGYSVSVGNVGVISLSDGINEFPAANVFHRGLNRQMGGIPCRTHRLAPLRRALCFSRFERQCYDG